MRLLRVVPASVLLALACPSSAFAATRTVDGLGIAPLRYKTVQAALNAATTGDTVDLDAGTWSECVTLPNKGKLLIERAPSVSSTVTLDCESASPAMSQTNAQSFTVSNLTIVAADGAAVSASSSDVTLSNVEISASSTGVIASTLTASDVSITSAAGVVASSGASLDTVKFAATGACMTTTSGTTTLTSVSCTTTSSRGFDLVGTISASDVDVSGATAFAMTLADGTATLDTMVLSATGTALFLDSVAATVTDSELSGNYGVVVSAGSSLSLTGGSIDGTGTGLEVDNDVLDTEVDSTTITGSKPVTVASGSFTVTNCEITGSDGLFESTSGDVTISGSSITSTTAALYTYNSDGALNVSDSTITSTDDRAVDAVNGSATFDTVLAVGFEGNRIRATSVNASFSTWLGTAGDLDIGLEVDGVSSGPIDSLTLYANAFAGSEAYQTTATTVTASAVDHNAADNALGTDITTYGADNVVGALALDAAYAPGLRSAARDLAPVDATRTDLIGTPRDYGSGADAGCYEVIDTDGDGISDTLEAAWSLNPASVDSDGDGVDDLDEWGTGATPQDTDDDGIVDALDTDDDGDSVATVDDCAPLDATIGAAPTWYLDGDADGYGGSTSQIACDVPSAYVATSTDCDDVDPDVHPGAVETCDGVDDNCDGTVDENTAVDAQTWYADTDGDGFGDPASDEKDCLQPTGFVGDDTDCDDTSAAVNPSGVEACNGVDDNCNGSVDEPGATGESLFYVDADGDGYGDSSSTVDACSLPTGDAIAGGDCDDSVAGTNPGASELCNGVDDDCNGTIDDGCTGTPSPGTKGCGCDTGTSPSTGLAGALGAIVWLLRVRRRPSRANG